MSWYHRTPVAQELSGTALLCFHRTKAHPRHEELKCLIIFRSDVKYFQVYMYGDHYTEQVLLLI